VHLAALFDATQNDIYKYREVQLFSELGGEKE
jgi:hypothetical protein